MDASGIERSLGASYTVERALSGGMSRVFVAHDESLGRRIVIKVLEPELAGSVNIERFRREIRVAAQLVHPHIVPLLQAGVADGLPYYTMPYLDGESLRTRLQRDGRLGIDDAARLGIDIANALDYAHRCGVVHRDIKPENILLHDGHALVTDFGIARAVTQAAVAQPLTQIGVMLGTPAYMSPEQAFGDADVDARSDVYSLGCVLYEMLVGQPPYTGPTTRAIVAQHLSAPAPRVRDTRTDVPTYFDAAIDSALAKEPAQRFPTAADLAAVLVRGRSASDSAHATRETPPHSAPIAVAKPHSIVVIPFATLNVDADTEFFAEGLSEELITDLSRIASLRVISRVSARQLKGTTKDVKTIGRELDVQSVLSGSVRRVGKDLRVTAQLVDVVNNAEVWGDAFSATLDELFDVQERLSRTIVAALRAKLTSGESDRLASRPIRDVRAYQCFLRAQNEVFLQPEAAIRTAKRGLAIVGDNALLYGILGYANANRALVATIDRESWFAEAERGAARAAALDGTSSYPGFIRGFVQFLRGNVQSAVALMKQALTLDPRNPDLLFWLIQCYVISGKAEPARPLARELGAIDPLNPNSRVMSGYVEEVAAGNLEAAMEPYREIYEAFPENPYTRWSYAFTISWNGLTDEACAVLRAIIEDTPTDFFAMLARFREPALRRDRDAALRCVTPELISAAEHNMFWAFVLAEQFALIGETNEALTWLRTAAEHGFINYPALADHDPLLANLRGHAEFDRFLQEIRARWLAFEV